MKVIACDDNSTIGRVEGSRIEIYSLIGEVDLREGENVYTLLHAIDEPDMRERVSLYR